MSTATLEPVQRLIADEMSAVDQVIRRRLHSDVVLIRQVSEHIINGGGKRLRPALVLLAAGACGYSGNAHYQLAAVVEFIHTATLLHDDVVDDSDLRRGQATANAQFGNAASVLVGDFLYSRAFQMMVELKNIRVMEVLADATNTIAEGEVLQLINCHDPAVTEEDYLRVIRYKTAKLFEAAAQIGAIISQAIRRGTAAQAGIIRGAIEHGGLEEFQPVLATIRDTGALEYTRRQATLESQRAMEAVASLPHSSYRDSLLQLAAFTVSRTY
jgi:octaprenyl-diphosphate synthase